MRRCEVRQNGNFSSSGWCRPAGGRPPRACAAGAARRMTPGEGNLYLRMLESVSARIRFIERRRKEPPERRARQKLQPQIETHCPRLGNPLFTLTGPRSAGQSRNRCLPWLPRVPWLPAPPSGIMSRVPGGLCRHHGWVSYPPLSVFPSTKSSSETASPR